MSVIGLSYHEPGQRRFDPDEAADLRRRNRSIAEEICARAEHLEPFQRELVRAVYRDGRSAKEVAALVGSSSRSVRFRLHRIVRRLMSDEFVFVIRNMERWGRTRRDVARATFINGLTLRAASRTLGLSVHVVRRHYHAVLVLLEHAR